MRKYLLYTAIIFLVAACQKENLQPPNNEEAKTDLKGNTYKVNFSSSGFKSSLIPMAKMARASIMNVDDTVRNINFFIYDSENNLVGNFAQTSLDEDFGNLTIDLQEGTYKIGVVGYPGGGYLDNNFQTIYFSPDFDYDPPFSDNKETFVYGYKNIEVNNDSTYAPFELKRLTSLLEIEILDKIPEEADNLRVTFEAETGLIVMFDEDEVSHPIESLCHYFDLTPYHNQDSAKLQTVVVPLLKSGAPMPLTVKVYDRQGQVLKDYSFELNFKSNYITRLTGKLFNTSTEGGNVSVSTSIIKEYDGEIEEEF